MLTRGGTSGGRRVLILPVENQVRELDAKLLIALLAAQRGYRVFIGSRAYVHFNISDIPRGIYVAKSMRSMSALMFQITRDLGHQIVAWEEEALVHPPAETFYALRLSPDTLKHTSDLFCWGENDRALMAGYPLLPTSVNLHVTGNPRGDMLRADLRAYFEPAVRAIKQKYGDYVLVNTNFSDVNPFMPAIGLYQDKARTRFGQAGKGMTPEFARGLYAHKLALFEAFVRLLKNLGRDSTTRKIIVRPHPSENLAAYHDLAAAYDDIVVNNTGNVLPWLIGSDGVLHNGCTTAIEAYAMGIPTLTYMPIVNQLYDYDFQGVPNELSTACTTEEAVRNSFARIGDVGREQRSAARSELLDHHISGLSGRLASERVLDILDQMPAHAESSMLRRLKGASQAKIKANVTQLVMRRPGHNRQQYHDHRFPPLASADIQERLDRLAHALTQTPAVTARLFSKHVFEISRT